MYRAVKGESSSDESSADASQLGALPTVRRKLGCFNCGINQDMLSKAVHVRNLSRVIAKGVHEQDLHMLTLCEVGSHKEGLGIWLACQEPQPPLTRPPGEPMHL